jgi:hypothetical protein
MKTVQFARGTATQNDAFTGAQGQVTVDTTDNTLRVHDGTTVGGHKTVKPSQVPSLAPVQSVAGKTGTVTLAKGDVGLSNVDNTSDANKPISTATQAALDDKAALEAANTFTARNQFPSLDVNTDKARALKGSESRVVALGSVTGTVTVDLAAGNVFTATATGNITLAFSNPPGANQTQVAYLRLTNGGAFTVTYPAGTKYASGTAPTLTASGTDLLAIFFDPASNTYVVGVAYKDFK